MQSPEPAIRLRSSARTSTGQKRENNEDHIHLKTGDNFVLAMVADGMGGAAAGEEASRIAVETVRDGISMPNSATGGDADSAPITEQLRDAFQVANLEIVRKAISSPEMRGMGTTLTVVMLRGTYATFAHVGDSRAYLVHDNDLNIVQITSDHTFVQALVLAGHLPPEQAEDHPMGNVLYRALGQAEQVEVDVYFKRLRAGDRLVLCSDGLTRHVKPNEIAGLVLSHSDPDSASQALIDLANARGGEDNISVIVIAVEGNPDAVFQQDDEVDEAPTLVLKQNPFRRRQAATEELNSVEPVVPDRAEGEGDSRSEGRDARIPEQ